MMRFTLSTFLAIATAVSAAEPTLNLRRLNNGQGSLVDLAEDLAENRKYNANKGSRDLDDLVNTSDGSIDGSVIKSYVVLKAGEKVAEYYRGDVSPTTQNNVFSVNKGFTSVFYAMLIEQGVFSLTDTLGDIWASTDPVWTGVTDASLKQQVTIEQLLDSTTGFDDPGFTSPLFDATGGQTLAEVLEFLQSVSPVGDFNYIGFANVLNYVILERLGETPQDWAAANFFPFLGMTDYTWSTNGDGVARARNGLSLTTLDMAKLGQLLLQKGKSSPTNQLFPSGWADDITSSRVTVPSDNSLRGAQGLSSDDPVGYSLMYWNIEDLGCTCAFGASGQYICFWPQDALVASLTSDFSTASPAAARQFLTAVTEANFRGVGNGSN